MWFVMCDATRAVSLPDVAPALDRRRVKVISLDVARLEAEDEATGYRVRVAASATPDVLVEADEIAGLVRRPELAAFGHRYEIAFALEHGVDVLNAVLAISEVLAAATGGVVFDAASGELVG